jgi:peptide/nickel transport system substrate-binding protein
MRTPPSEIAGLGPFRLKEYAAGQRIVLERNPYYWKTDSAGNRLPYLAEVNFAIAGTEDLQVLRFRSGEADIINRVGAKNFAALQKDADRRGQSMVNAGGGFEYNFLFFNLNDLPATAPAAVRDHQRWFRSKSFRQAVSAAINRDDLVRLVYQGFAQALATVVPPGSKAWVDTTLPRPVRSVARARELLRADGFRWSPDGSLVDSGGKRVEFTIAVSASNSERGQMAAIIQDDLKALGIKAEVAPLEFRSLLDRVQKTYDYDACVLGLGSADADPNVEMGVWLTSGPNHLWHLRREGPPADWEREIDTLMTRQIGVMKYADRKRMFDRVQQLAMEYLPMIPLVTPNVLVGVKKSLGNFRPALLDHNSLWNIEELFWRTPGGGSPK